MPLRVTVIIILSSSRTTYTYCTLHDTWHMTYEEKTIHNDLITCYISLVYLNISYLLPFKYEYS